MMRGGAGAAALALLLVPAGGFAQTGSPSGVNLTPARAEADLAARDVRLSFRVTNYEATPRSVDVAVAGLTHDLEGTVDFPAGTAPRGLRASVPSATLPPGASTEVRVEGSLPPGATAMYGGFVVTLRPVTAGTGQVGVTNRIAAPILVRGPKPWREAVKVDGVGITATGTGRGARVEAVVRNTGNVHVRPTGTVTVRRADRVVVSRPLPQETILPGLARRLGVGWDVPAEDDGPFDVEVALDGPAATARVRDTFDPLRRAAPEGATQPSLVRTGGDGGIFGGGRSPGGGSSGGGPPTGVVALASLLLLSALAAVARSVTARSRDGRRDTARP